jgi:hypothetical protein
METVFTLLAESETVKGSLRVPLAGLVTDALAIEIIGGTPLAWM